MKELTRRNSVRAAVLVLVLVCGWMTRLPSYSSAEQDRLASQFAFRKLTLPVAAKPFQTSRRVEPSLQTISGWISSVGAAVSLSDLDGNGKPDDICLVDPRSNAVTVAPAPMTGRRFAPFVLAAAPLRYDPQTTAPMGCLPGDFNEDGRIDLLVYYWGRTPILFLRRPNRPFGPDGFTRRELVPKGGRWYTDTITSADVDGDGNPDLIVGNYFPDGARVLDPSARRDPAMQMQNSMSRGRNGGIDRILLWRPGGRFVEAPGALPPNVANAWTLAIGAADLDGDLRPELYFANDFGPDVLLRNDSTPGHVRFTIDHGSRSLTTPASKVLGRDSFKGMGIDFGDLNGDGRLDMFVGNITTQFALEESNFAWIAKGSTSGLAHGHAPYTDESEPLGISRSGWSWDGKIGDFADSGANEIVQATGFLAGKVDRWPELQELAMANDTLIHHATVWPRFAPGDDLSGHQHMAFFVPGPAGRFVDLSTRVGLGATVVSRGIATADVNADGRLDFAVADQWAPSYLYVNASPGRKHYLGLRLLLPPVGVASATREVSGLPGGLLARPAIGAGVSLRLANGRTLVGQIDGGNGHASVRAPEILFGLGAEAVAHLPVRIVWRDTFGVVWRATFRLRPGWHTIVLAQGQPR
ncbi:MAG: CRTAC1 family protein [Gaiellaceae bacterium]